MKRPPLQGQFRLSGRVIDWVEVYTPRAHFVDVRSGEFWIRIGARSDDRSTWFWLGPVVVLGHEFPLGARAEDLPFILDGQERNAQLHTDFIRATVERCHRRRRFVRKPLTSAVRESLDLSKSRFAESAEERSQREEQEQAAQRALDEVARKDALFTRYQCPLCGKPCPSYRRTCKHCAHAVTPVLPVASA